MRSLFPPSAQACRRRGAARHAAPGAWGARAVALRRPGGAPPPPPGDARFAMDALPAYAATPAFWTIAVLAAVLVGMGKGGLPMVAMLAVPLLALVMHPVAATALLAPIYVLTDMFGLHAYRHSFSRRVVAVMAPGATLGVGLGWLTASVVPERLVTGLIGAIGAAFAVRLLTARGRAAPPRRARAGPGTFWGVITGFTSFVSHAGGPPYQVFVLPLGLDKLAFAGTTTVLFAYVNLIKLVPYWALGQMNPGSLAAAAFLIVPGIAGVYAGVHLVRVIPERAFFRFVIWALLAVSARLLWMAAAG